MVAVSVATLTLSCSSSQQNKYAQTLLPQEQNFSAIDAPAVAERVDIFAPYELTADISHLSDKEKQILSIWFDVADIMEDLFWKQAIGDKEQFLGNISDLETKRFATINYGPWDRLDGNSPFIAGIGEKPRGANFYPVDMTKEEFEAYSDEAKSSLYTVLRRDAKGALVTVPYSVIYKDELTKASNLLKEAAELAEDPGLKRYLTLRAEALVTDNYQPSDFAWMEMQNANIDFVVGPIENYEDALYGYKAAFESFILIKDLEWSAKLAKYAAMLPAFQAELPIEEAYKKEVPGSKADINAYDVVYYRGDCNAGSKTIAINLPNDEEVHVKFGSRKLQLKNAMKAKFDKILVPISDVLIDPAQRKYITFRAFFENTMFHEVSHAMGIKTTVDGSQTVRAALKEQYSAIEEGKADIMGLYLVTRLYEMGELTEGEVMDNYVTFFAGIFRSSRFGAASAHGKANMLRINFFKEKGAFTRNDDGTYTIHFEPMREAMILLMQKILHIQGDGDYEAAREWIRTDGIIKPQLQADLDRLGDANIPVDIVFGQGKANLGL
ncbi:MAG: Zn-dependent hydrolase [Bacteroidetes bacterium]|nr:MAG: Zn-dependent hydrolase [Bacteroidota bacterium]